MNHTQDLEHTQFISSVESEQLNQKPINPSKLHSNNNRTNSNSNTNNKSYNQNFNLNQNNRKAPHYWPADRVPYLGIKYCQLIQYIFAALFILVLIWIFWGIKHFDNIDKANVKKVIKNPQVQSLNRKLFNLEVES